MATPAEALDAALRLHRGGNLVEAQKSYQAILRADPLVADAWHLLGLVFYAQGDSARAVKHIERAITIDGAQPSFHNHLAEAYRTWGRLDQAEASCRQALRLKEHFPIAWNTLGLIKSAQGEPTQAANAFAKAIAMAPDFATAHCNLGELWQSQGKLDEAVACYRRAAEVDPRSALAWHRQGTALAEQGRTEAAIDAFRHALSLDPQSAESENNLGALLQARGQVIEAQACYERALVIRPDYAQAHCNLGSALKDQGQAAAAAQAYEAALRHNPRLAEAHFNLGVLLQNQNQTVAAVECYRRAIEAKPSYAEAYNNLGTLDKADGNLSESIACFERALEFKPNFAEALNNLGNVFKTQGRIDEAWVCYEQSLRIKPDYIQSRYNRALMCLAAGNLAAGWPDYELRCHCPGFPIRTFEKPRWHGEPLEGRTLLVFAEQGLGDTLQFARYVNLLAERDTKLVFEVPRALVPLWEQSGYANIARLVAKDEPLGQFDVQAPLLSLPGMLGTTLQNIPAAVPYLAVAPDRVAAWYDKLAAIAKPKLRVGIGWQGSTTFTGDAFRSIPLEQFAPLAMQEVELISLQKGFGSEQIAQVGPQFHVRELGSEFDAGPGAFLDTAAVMKNLDLVITSDTAIAHLAGALGVRAWVALAIEPDWRWLREGARSPWYPTMRLFRQRNFNEWGDVFVEMAAELRGILAARSKS